MCGSELTPWPEGVQRVVAELQRWGHAHTPVWLPEAARTAQQAADGLGVALGQIAKSLVFRRDPDGAAVLVVAAGDHRVSEARVQSLVCGPGQTLGRASADFVKRTTGFSIGGVSPLAHRTAPVALVDRALFRFESVWAAAGHPHAVFLLHPSDLVRWLQAPVADVAEGHEAVAGADGHAVAAPGPGPSPAPVDPPSPCVGVCRMAPGAVPRQPLCAGCLRTLEEIGQWSRASAAAKTHILAQLPQRRLAA